MFDIKKLRAEAEKEIAEEKLKRAKNLVVAKLRERETARKVLANIERELEDLYATISEDA